MRRFALLALVPAGCSDAPVASIEPASGMRLLPGPGAEAALEARAYDADGNELAGAALAWRSEDPSVVEVRGEVAVAVADVGWTHLVASSGGASRIGSTSTWRSRRAARFCSTGASSCRSRRSWTRNRRTSWALGSASR